MGLVVLWESGSCIFRDLRIAESFRTGFANGAARVIIDTIVGCTTPGVIVLLLICGVWCWAIWDKNIPKE
jgi:hypothetical protein